MGPLKTRDGILITNDNEMANATNNYFISVFTIGQLNNVPQLGQYEGNILDTFNFISEEVQDKLQHLNIYKSTLRGFSIMTVMTEQENNGAKRIVKHFKQVTGKMLHFQGVSKRLL